MCGIAGFSSRQGVSVRALERMAETITHRGPNDEGYFGIGLEGASNHWKHSGVVSDQKLRVGLGFRRLSILDLSENGAQPMEYAGDRLIFNGQIYNYKGLRDQHRMSGLRSTGDTEVLLRLLHEKGSDSLLELNGIYGFAFWNSRDRELLLARDPLGIKPLYYSKTADTLFFASEIRALLSVIPGKPKLRTELLSRYLSCGWIPDPDTLFSGIQKLEPGCFMKVVEGEYTLHRFWDYQFHPDEEKSESQWEEELDSILKDVVGRQLQSDVPLGFFLSGGLDSTLLTEFASHGKRTPGTFTVGFDFGKGDAGEYNLDLTTARELAKRYGWRHRELVLKPSVVSLMEEATLAVEEPMNDPASLCNYLICREAKSQYTVMISGHGADEIFGGYPLYRGGKLLEELLRFPKFTRTWAREFLDTVGWERSQLFYRIRKLLMASEGNWPEGFCRLRSALWPEEMERLIAPELLSRQLSPFKVHLSHFEKVKSQDAYTQMMYLDLKTYLGATNLNYTDKTSMAHSVELRVPYLDLKLMEYTARLPSRYKIGREGKRILKRVGARHLPPLVLQRKKTGFGLPIREWLREDLYPLAKDLMSESRLRKQGLFDPKLPELWLSEHRSNRRDQSLPLYLMLAFQQWVEAFEVGIS